MCVSVSGVGEGTSGTSMEVPVVRDTKVSRDTKLTKRKKVEEVDKRGEGKENRKKKK